MFAELKKIFAEIAPACDFCSLRVVREQSEILTVRRDVPEPLVRADDFGAMLTIVDNGGYGYAATADLSRAGLTAALREARHWADVSRGKLVFTPVAFPHPVGSYTTPVAQAWSELSLKEKYARLRAEVAKLKADERIVHWEGQLWSTDVASLYLTTEGGEVEQRQHCLAPDLKVAAYKDGETQRRSLGMPVRQGGLEVLDAVGFYTDAPRLAAEACALLDAENCPTGRMDLLLDGGQMILQIHESIGHPLEVDRILGDERNYAGTSFVTPDMFGSYQYGSELLNVTFDPKRTGELASYSFDDDGMAAEREYIIKDGVLMRGLGGHTSQLRSGLPGVANSRACSWNRPPIDRMANLNLELGSSSLASMIAEIESGVYMQTNCSWSIDDSRNKFQFGCELGRKIENGQLGPVLKNCNYRGISASFWRNLKRVGDASSQILTGTPYCGKGEPNQCVRVGHASPACLFGDVEVFGGE